LGDSLHLVYYDHRGNGRSGRPSIDTLTHDQFCADADALRIYLGFDKVVVLGNSYGGFIALEYALRYPEHFSHLILTGTAPALNYGEEVLANARRKGATEEMMTILNAPNPVSDAEMQKALEIIGPLYFYHLDADLANRAFGQTIYDGATGLHAEQ